MNNYPLHNRIRFDSIRPTHSDTAPRHTIRAPTSKHGSRSMALQNSTSDAHALHPSLLDAPACRGTRTACTHLEHPSSFANCSSAERTNPLLSAKLPCMFHITRRSVGTWPLSTINGLNPSDGGYIASLSVEMSESNPPVLSLVGK
jgi:hypothetical protein